MKKYLGILLSLLLGFSSFAHAQTVVVGAIEVQDSDLSANVPLLDIPNTFTADLNIDAILGIIEGGASPSFHTFFQGGDQSGDITYTLPTAQGGASTVFTNDGSGILSWALPAGGLDNIVEDLTPQLGGDLDTNSFDITSSGGLDIILGAGSELSLPNAHIQLTDNFQLRWGGATTYIRGSGASDLLQFFINGTNIFEVNADGVNFEFGTALIEEAVNILALKTGVSAQEFRIFNTTDGGSNFEFLSIGLKNNSDLVTFGSEAGGTGVARDFAFIGDSVGIFPGGKVFFQHNANLDQRIGGTSFAPAVQVSGSAPGTPNSSAALSISMFSTANTEGGKLFLSRSRNNTIGTHDLVIDGNVLGRLVFSGSDGTNFTNAAMISALVDGTPGFGDMPGRLVFSTTVDGDASVTDRWIMDSSGHFTAFVDNTYDVGSTGAARPRDAWFTRAYSMTAQASTIANGSTNEVRLYTDESTNRTGGGATDCALIARLSDATEIMIDVLVIDGACP